VSVRAPLEDRGRREERSEASVRLPGGDRAVIEAAKLRRYLLSSQHPLGRFKSAFFRGLGYTESNWRRLDSDLRDVARLGEARVGQESAYGQKYEVRSTLRGPFGRRAEVVTVWIVVAGDDFPRFVTAYPGEPS
jgi:hypothetical protein